MKCIVCILRGTDNKDISTSNPVQDAVDNAKEAVTVTRGQAFCVQHLHEDVISHVGDIYIRNNN